MALSKASCRALYAVPARLSRFSTVASAGNNHGMELPPVKSMKNVPQQGWQCATEVRPSKIPQAGNGRFATEVVKAKSPIVEKVLVPMTTVQSLLSLPNNASITFSSKADLEKYIELSQKEGGYSREEVHNLFEHFMYGFDGRHACLNVSTWTVNHGDTSLNGMNVDFAEKVLADGSKALVGETTVDVNPNDEFYMDYRKFKLPNFYLEYAKDYGFSDVRTATVDAVYGGGKSLEHPAVKAMKDVPNQGWPCSTEVRTSLIPGAGNGRYAREIMNKGSAVVSKVLKPMANIDSLVGLPNDTTITFETEAELEKYVDLAQKEGGYSRVETLDLFEHFIYGFDGRRACLNVSTWTVNHGEDGLNGVNVNVVEKKLANGETALVGEATKDIQINEEFYMDYRKFSLPLFYNEYTKKNGFKDVRTATVEGVYGFKAGVEHPAVRAIKGVENQGWQFDTHVRTSLIPGAGNGRYASEIVKADSSVIEKVLKPMASIDTLEGLASNVTITFETEAELEKYIQLAHKEGGWNRTEILHLFEHFIYGFDGRRACLNASTWTVNHGEDGLNGVNINVVEKKLANGEIALVGEATKDIQVDDEFYMDYRKFSLPLFYNEYTKKHGFNDVRTATVEGVYGFNAGIEHPTVRSIKGVENQGWRFNNEVRTSQIPGAGNGRYATEAVKAQSSVVEKVMVPMSSLDSLQNLANDTTVTFENVSELEKYIDLAHKEGGYSRAETLDLFCHFIYGFDGRRACLNVSTWTVNHANSTADGLNIDVVEKQLADGRSALVGEAMVDIKPGDEFYLDYLKFKLPQFYVDYANQNGFKDVRTAVLEAISGSA